MWEHSGTDKIYTKLKGTKRTNCSKKITRHCDCSIRCRIDVIDCKQIYWRTVALRHGDSEFCNSKLLKQIMKWKVDC